MKDLIISKIKALKEINPELLKAKVDFMLVDEEELLRAYQSTRDYLILTTKRVIFVDIQGITGKKQEYRSIGYSKISSFSVETAGTFDFDSEMKLWVSGLGIFEIEFAKKIVANKFEGVINAEDITLRTINDTLKISFNEDSVIVKALNDVKNELVYLNQLNTRQTANSNKTLQLQRASIS